VQAYRVVTRNDPAATILPSFCSRPCRFADLC
jgi:hypothetical protein